MKKIKDFMSHDHNRLDRMFRSFLRIREQDRAQALDLFHEFKVGLLKHIDWEEEILFPLIERRTGMNMPGPAALVRIQHQQIKALLEKVSLQIAGEGPWTEESEKGVIDLLALHNREEETVLYPWIDISLSQQDREEALEIISPSAAKESS